MRGSGPEALTIGLGIRASAVHVAAVADSNNEHDEPAIFYRIEDSVIAHPNPVNILSSRQLHSSIGTRFSCEGVDSVRDTPLE